MGAWLATQWKADFNLYAAIIVPQLLVPPLVACEALIPNITPKMLDVFSFYPSKFWNEDKWWSPLSYMFLHMNEAHLFGNVFGQILTFPCVHNSLGAGGLYLTFFGGGIYGVLVDHFPTEGFRWFHWAGDKVAERSSSGEERKALWERFLRPILGGREDVERRPSVIGRFFNGVCNSIESFIDRYTPKKLFEKQVIGSSAGVYALSGACFMAHTEQLSLHVYQLYREIYYRTESDPYLLANILIVTSRLAQESGLFSVAYDALCRDNSSIVSFEKTFHRGHVNGFVFGVLIHCSIRLAQYGTKLAQKCRERWSSSSGRGGRRLDGR